MSPEQITRDDNGIKVWPDNTRLRQYMPVGMRGSKRTDRIMNKLGKIVSFVDSIG